MRALTQIARSIFPGPDPRLEIKYFFYASPTRTTTIDRQNFFYSLTAHRVVGRGISINYNVLRIFNLLYNPSVVSLISGEIEIRIVSFVRIHERVTFQFAITASSILFSSHQPSFKTTLSSGIIGIHK